MSETALDLLYRAYRSERGIVVTSSDPVRLRAKLYAERKKDADLECLSITLSRTQPESQLWIVKK